MDRWPHPDTVLADDVLRRHVVDTALRIAHRAGSWDAVHVREVAAEAGCSLEQVHRCFRDKDAIGDGVFDAADDAMLALHREPGWLERPVAARLEAAVLAWLDALAPHRLLVREMLGYKLHPEHVHLQVLGVARVSRTVQWLRDVAALPANGWRRELEEAVLTSVYLATFACWLTDATPGQQRTRALLARLLQGAERGALALGFGR